MTNGVELIWSSGALQIHNPTPTIEKVLQYVHRSMEQNEKTYDREIVKEDVQLFHVVQENPRVIVTYQGFIDRVREVCERNALPYVVADQREPMPGPRMNLMKGFRCRQVELFIRLLHANRSGCLKAPTRYGKTTLIANTLRVFPNIKTLITAPGVDLLKQLQSDLTAMLPSREIKGIYSGSKGKQMSDDITLVSMDSLHRVEDPDSVRLILVDEPHSGVSPTRAPLFLKFRKARFLAYGATLSGRFDGADCLIEGLFGPILAARSFKEGVAEGAICNIVVYVVRVPFTPYRVFKRDAAYRDLLYRNHEFDMLVKSLSDRIVPPDWQTLMFVDEVKQADLLQLFVDTSEIAIAGRMNKEQREDMFQRMVSNEIKRCICTDIYATGVTFPDLRVIINASGGGGGITSTQKPGRLAQIRPGKKCGYLIDFQFEPDSHEHPTSGTAWSYVVQDCYNRIKTYRSNGYEIRTVKSIDQIVLE